MQHIMKNIAILMTTLITLQTAHGFSQIEANYNDRLSQGGTAIQQQVYNLMKRVSFQTLKQATGETRADVLLDESNFRSYPLSRINDSRAIIRLQTAANNTCLGSVEVEADLDAGEVTANAELRCISPEGFEFTGQGLSNSSL